jgi:hypothetical protein
MRTRLLSAALLAGLAAVAAHKAPKGGLFSRDNLVAWCIVPFDAKQRSPAERVEMLHRLGIRMLAYDWRAKDIPTFDREVDELAKRRIRLQAFWLSSGLKPQSDKNVATVLDFLKRRNVKTELWYFVSTPKEFNSLPQAGKVQAVAGAVGYVAAEARKIRCKVGIYNHGGWTGEPENQIEVIRRLGMDNVGIVYNFHHGREQMARFPDLLEKMTPYLLALNLNGMKQGAPMILPLGEGDRELDMIRVIRSSRYTGPIGILNHRTEVDAETGLRQNMDGLRKILEQLGDKRALATYRNPAR